MEKEIGPLQTQKLGSSGPTLADTWFTGIHPWTSKKQVFRRMMHVQVVSKLATLVLCVADLLVVPWLTGRVNESKSRLDGHFHIHGRLFLFPGSSIDQKQLATVENLRSRGCRSGHASAPENHTRCNENQGHPISQKTAAIPTMGVPTQVHPCRFCCLWRLLSPDEGIVGDCFQFQVDHTE